MGTAGHEAEVWAEIAARGADIGRGVVIRFYGNGDCDKAGILLYHQHPDGAVCGGSVPFDVPANDWHRQRARPLWQVQSLEPLTLSPSILDPDCGLHGHIVNGLWVPC